MVKLFSQSEMRTGNMQNKVRTKAVENFLSSLDLSLDIADHFQNCLDDALSYAWNKETIHEIMKGIEDAYKPKEN